MPRRYGFHATLKAPFHLSPSCTEQQLVNALHSFAGLGHAIRSFTPTLRLLDDFFAVVPLQADATIEASGGVVHDDIRRLSRADVAAGTGAAHRARD